VQTTALGLLIGKRSHTCADAYSLHAGDWDAAGKRDAARPAAEDEDDEDAFGEFEDLETGVYLCVCACACACLQNLPCIVHALGNFYAQLAAVVGIFICTFHGVSCRCKLRPGCCVLSVDCSISVCESGCTKSQQ
jgi:hypothetical protein